MMQTKLEQMAVRRITELSKEAQMIVLVNHQNMGALTAIDSGFGKLNERLKEIEQWAEALGEAGAR